jgi:hypothetical protein
MIDWEGLCGDLQAENDMLRERLENALEHAREKRRSNTEQDPMAVKIIVDKRNAGFTWQAIADLLNQNYVKTPRGKLWFKASVQQVYKKWNGWV